MKHTSWVTSLILLILTACGPTPTPAPLVPTEAPAASQTGPIFSEGVIASATILPARQTQMSFALSAQVQEVLVKEGDLVMAGQTLIRLHSPDLELAVAAAEFEAEAMQLEYVYWIPRLDRPPERREQARAEMELAQARVETAKAALTQASLVAPFDATVVDITIQEGELAQPGRVVITLGDTGDMQVETTDLSERDIPGVQIGQSANVFIEALDVHVTGKVARISPFSNTVGGDVVYPVLIELDEQPDGLLWGMSAEVEIQTAE
jgi:multidrug efflux pump subunit AcrA (membrane-fusion protein)